MKKLAILSVIIPLTCLLLGSCLFSLNESITGNGNVVTRKRDAQPFEKLEASTNIRISVTFGDSYLVEVEADENLHDAIRTEFSNGRLKIYSRTNIRKASEKTVHVTVPKLKEIDLSAASVMYSRNKLITDDIDVNVSSAAKCELELEAENIEINISSAGQAELKGTAGDIEAHISSSGKLEAFDLEAEDGDIETSSAGKAYVNVQEKLTASASSGSGVYYKGKADVNSETSSGGHIERR